MERLKEPSANERLAEALREECIDSTPCHHAYEGEPFGHWHTQQARNILARLSGATLDEEHCCNDPEHMSPEYLAHLLSHDTT